jgi:hypothetical protein
MIKERHLISGAAEKINLAEERQRKRGKLYPSLFENMRIGSAYCRMLFKTDAPKISFISMLIALSKN